MESRLGSVCDGAICKQMILNGLVALTGVEPGFAAF